MARRSPMNDRYRVEQKGHTRKSASSAKPKREAGEAATAASKPKKKAPAKSAAKSTRWGRGPATTDTSVPSTPEMKRLRKIWWVLISAAVLLAFAMIPAEKLKNPTLNAVLLGTYAAALGGSLYMEFGPLRKARAAAIAAAKGKGGKGAKASAAAAADKEAPATTAGAPSVAGRMLRLIVGLPKKPKAADAAEASTDDDIPEPPAAPDDES